MTKDEIKNRISMALKDPILQQGFKCICKENAELRKFRELLAVGSKLNKGLISRNKFLEKERDKYRNMVFDKMERIDRAKDIIEKTVEGIRITYEHKGFITDVDDFLSEAEQFLQEVE
jgi:hypothetical protein